MLILFFDGFCETKEMGMFHNKNFEHFITRYHKKQTFRDILDKELFWDGYVGESALFKMEKNTYKRQRISYD